MCRSVRRSRSSYRNATGGALSRSRLLSRPLDRRRGLGGDSGTLTLAGDWLTQSGLLGQPLRIEALPSRITIRAELGTMLA
ncbi:hypothetical protein CUU52_19695 [Pectobacterium polaris]|nr:hypothetical protein [Pectobacterium polaris]